MKIVGHLFGDKLFYDAGTKTVTAQAENGPLTKFKLSNADRFSLAKLLLSGIEQPTLDNLLGEIRSGVGS